MYRLVSSIPLRMLLLEQAPALGMSLVIAELFNSIASPWRQWLSWARGTLWIGSSALSAGY